MERLVPRVRRGRAVGAPRPGLLVDAGCDEVAMHVVHPAGFDPDVKITAAFTTEGIAARAAAAGLATGAELESLARELHAFARPPRAGMSLPRIAQAWGRAAA